MALESLPPQLLNTTHKYCFEAGLGLALAHYNKLGNLTLKDIVTAVGRPEDEEYEAGFAWLQQFGLGITCIEKLRPEDEDVITAQRKIGVVFESRKPTHHTALEYATKDIAMLTLVNFDEPDDGSPDWELNHVVYLSGSDECVHIIDPDSPSELVIVEPDITEHWGRYPNLIVIEPV